MINVINASQLMLQAHKYGVMHRVGHVEYKIVEKNNQLIAVIPGTNDMKDMLDNIRFYRTKTLINNIEYKIHEGFLNQTNTIFDRIKNCDMFVGHSLGGAIAQICALKTGRPAITFGCPRVGNKRFARHIYRLHTRVKSRGDSITHIPPWWLGYCHGGKEIKIGNMNRPWWKFWASEDHLLEDYVKEVKNHYYNT